MKTKIRVTASLLALLFGSQGLAHGQHHGHYHPNSCVQEYYTKLSESAKLGECSAKKDLNLIWTVKTYPLLRENPRRVQYWEGSFVRPMNREMIFLRELVDVCFGKVISQNHLPVTVVQNLEFDVINPNLESNITGSYMLLPMTTQEAQHELSQTKNRCEEYSFPKDKKEFL